MKKYFIHNGSGQEGPFDIEELKLKNIVKDTPIWYEGLKAWTTAGQVEEINNILLKNPPPYSTNMISSTPSTLSIQKEIPDRNQNKRSSLTRKVLITFLVIIVALVGVFLYNQIQDQKYQSNRQLELNVEEDNKARIRNNITSYVTAERNEYTFNSLGGIYNLKIAVTNSTDYVIDLVKVKITYIKANGDVWDTRFVDFNMVKPQIKVTKSIEDTERGTSINYEIVSIKSNALGIN